LCNQKYVYTERLFVGTEVLL